MWSQLPMLILKSMATVVFYFLKYVSTHKKRQTFITWLQCNKIEEMSIFIIEIG